MLRTVTRSGTLSIASMLFLRETRAKTGVLKQKGEKTMPWIDSASFAEPGIYLLWPDGNRLALTRRFIESWTETMLNDPLRIPQEVRAATTYKPCDICPERDKATICHAIMPPLPFTGDIDRYMSYDSVTAIYRDEADNVINVVETTMQEALKFIAILSLTQYCEVGKKYGMYFLGVNPLMPPPDIAAAVYRHIFLAAGGDMAQVSKIIQTMRDEILLVTRCQMERLRLICANDAFLNAFVSTYNITELLFDELDSWISKTAMSTPLPH